MLLLMQHCKFKDSPDQTAPEDTINRIPKTSTLKNPELVYDNRGNIIERHGLSYRKADSAVRSQESYYYTYDDNSNVVKEIKESYTPDGELILRNINQYQYNDKNLKTDIVFESFDNFGERQRFAHHTFKYNEQGHKIEDTGYDQGGAITSRIIMEPDSIGRLQSEEFILYNDNGAIREHKKFIYSINGLQKTIDLMNAN